MLSSCCITSGSPQSRPKPKLLSSMWWRTCGPHSPPTLASVSRESWFCHAVGTHQRDRETSEICWGHPGSTSILPPWIMRWPRLLLLCSCSKNCLSFCLALLLESAVGLVLLEAEFLISTLKANTLWIRICRKLVTSEGLSVSHTQLLLGGSRPLLAASRTEK